MEKEYIVCLYRHEDLEEFYKEMEDNGFRLCMKRPMSRNTHYWMTDEQAEELKKDPRVWDVEDNNAYKVIPYGYINNTPYTRSGDFRKNQSNPAAEEFQWGTLHCAGTQQQRRKGEWGSDGTQIVNDTVTIFNGGKHVDVVIVDDPVSYDCEEWKSPSTGASRFVQYQWFNELNTIVNSIDDDGQTEPTGTITYYQNASNPTSHGNHVTGTACGKHYGWAREANIYNLAVTTAWSSLQIVGQSLVFDYLRAFHRNKPINPVTGKRNPTITNHSYGAVVSVGVAFTVGNVSNVYYRGILYTSSNPGPSGWTQTGLTKDFGIPFADTYFPAMRISVISDVQDAMREGVVVIGAAGNDNLMIDNVDGPDYYNFFTTLSGLQVSYHRGGAPNGPLYGGIVVGAQHYRKDFRRTTFSNYGPGVDIFAPGENIVSAYNSSGIADTKYGGAPNYYASIDGTSMASPQVCGVIACVASASGKDRFTQEDAVQFLKKYAIADDMTFDINGGGFDDNTCRKGSPNLYLHIENPRPTSGNIDTIPKGSRTNEVVYPRRTTLFTTQ